MRLGADADVDARRVEENRVGDELGVKIYLFFMNITFVFSYWIFAWFLLYELNVIKYSPKLALLFGLFENIFLFLAMIYYSNPIIKIILFCIINFFIKLLPLWILRNQRIHTRDFLILMGVFILYLGWVSINSSIVDLFKESIRRIQQGESVGPLTEYLIKLK
jgi:hypothetical protein